MGLVTPVEPVPFARLGRRVHMVGIGGAGMSGLARILLARGIAVSGCDSAASPVLDELAALGATVHVGHAAAHVGDVDTVVATSAVRSANPELAEAGRRGLPVLHRAAALASCLLGSQMIAVAGTHGKTTTTSMITTVLRHCGANPGYVIGGILAETGVSAEDSDSGTFVIEADESDGSFLMFSPSAAVVTSVEADHLDRYASLDEIEAAFAAFARRIAPGGLLVACADDPRARAVAEQASTSGGSRRVVPPAANTAPVRAVSYGTAADADYRLTEATVRAMSTRLRLTGGPGTRLAGEVAFDIKVPGRHYAMNAAAAFAMCAELGYPPDKVAAGLASYRGAQRRMEPRGEADGVLLLDSYSHHPTELAADLTAARELADGGRVIAVFQPHLFSRTRIFAAEFGAALGLADEALVLDVYAAREDPEPGVTGKLVADAVPGGRAEFLPDRASVPGAVAGLAKSGDLVLTMGAGDVTALGPQILAALRERAGEPL